MPLMINNGVSASATTTTVRMFMGRLFVFDSSKVGDCPGFVYKKYIFCVAYGRKKATLITNRAVRTPI